MQDGYRLNLQAIWPVARERQSLELSPVRRDVAPIDPVVLRRAGMHYCSRLLSFFYRLSAYRTA